MTPKRMKHDYTNEIELKSLLIREKVSKLVTSKDQEDISSQNTLINEMIQEYLLTKDKNLANAIIKLSENTPIDSVSREKFGKIIVLMIQKILTKPNFSGYSWVDEFYSDSCYRVFKYLHNFDHTKISKISGQSVSAFAYISQIIHNAILAIILEHNKEAEEKNSLSKEYNQNYDVPSESNNKSSYEEAESPKEIIKIDSIDDFFKLQFDNSKNYDVIYPKTQVISFEQYAKIREVTKLYKCSISIIRER